MYKTHRQNHDFQIAHFLAGSCHTPDGAYALLCDLKEDRQAAIKHYEVSMLRTRAKQARLEEKLTCASGADLLEVQADIQELINSEETGAVLFDAAKDELAFILDCIDRLQPYRKYKDMTDHQAHEAAQQEEWKLELICRAENYMITGGTIPADHFATMRMHPEFAQHILPKIAEIKQILAAGGEGVERLLQPPPFLKLILPSAPVTLRLSIPGEP